MDAITGRKNPKVAHMKKLGSSHAYRLERGEFLCDGEKLLAEAVKNGAQVKTVMYCGDAPDVCPPGAGIYSVPRDIIEYISPLKTPQNILFSVGIPNMEGQLPEGGRYIILDAVSDPGNVGTVIRTADAFGIDAVIFMGECAD
ncbi:MAG: RNA methyltransferase, partial [Oscillospiraceae bacterium]|nr:RNA methyltransferase [Oscillospiraceae bacterium]